MHRRVLRFVLDAHQLFHTVPTENLEPGTRCRGFVRLSLYECSVIPKNTEELVFGITQLEIGRYTIHPRPLHHHH